MRDLLSQTPWDLIWDTEINNCWNGWKDLLLAAIDDCIPIVNAKNTQEYPWISRDLIKLSRKKKAAFKRAKKSWKNCDWNYYKNLNTLVKRESNLEWQKYITNLSDKITHNNNSKPFWRYVNSKRQCTNDLVLLKLGENKITEDTDMAESMNGYFSSVFTDMHFTCTDFWNVHQVFNQHQFGYLHQKSIVAQVLLCFNDWAEARNNGNATRCCIS